MIFPLLGISLGSVSLTLDASPESLRPIRPKYVARALYVRSALQEPALPPESAYAPKPTFTFPDLKTPTVPQLLGGLTTDQSFSTQGSSAISIVPPRTPKSIENTLVDIVCTNTDLNGILGILSASTKANLVMLAPNDAHLTLRLRQTKLSEALRHICALAGLAYLKVGNSFLLGSEDRLKAAYAKEWLAANPTPVDPKVAEKTAPVETPTPPAEKTITRIYTSNYADATQLTETLHKLFEGLNVVTGPSLRSPSLGERDASNSTGVTQGVLAADNKPAGRTLILRGPESMVEAALDAAKGFDVASAQVSIQVQIYDITDSALNELGVSWSIGGTSFTESDPKGINFGSFSRTPFNFGATIKALETADKAKILATPNVSVLDNERAFVLIGNKITLPKFDGYDANKIPIYSTNEYRVGIYLQVAPSVASDGSITMAIYPQVSTVVKTTEINGASYPDIATREAQTTLRVKSGDSIVLGGLLKNEDLEQLEQVPILSKIPLFGELFKRRKKTKSSSQVIITLTPTLIPSGKL